MKTLRDYINILEGIALLENPWEGKDPAKAATWAALSPEDQKWLGNADPTDQAILARAPNKGKPTQNVAATSQQGQQLAAQTAGMDDTASGVAGVQGGSQQDNMLAAQTAGMDEPAPTQTAAAKPPSAGASAEGDAGEAQAQAAQAAKQGQPAQAAVAAAPGANVPNPGQPAGQSATPAPAAAAANRDAMPFGKAFADARAKGEKEFTWKGKKYAVAVAKPAAAPAQAATPAPAQQPGLWSKFKNWATAGGQAGTPAAGTAPTGDIGTQMVAPESVEIKSEDMIAELNRIRQIAGLK